jgi:hypothetical protein
MRLSKHVLRPFVLTTAIVGGLITDSAGAQTESQRIDDALQNITALVRPGRVGYATVWDGNKYVQCRRQTDQSLRCEAAGAAMQPSLRQVLTGDRLKRLADLGWKLDPAFGNYAQTFPAGMPTARVADHILQTLIDVYDAKPTGFDLQTAWVLDVKCPQRNGPTQNLAGSVNDSRSMRATAVYCAYKEKDEAVQIARSAADLRAIYGAIVTAEIQRLRINASGNKVHAIFDAGIGYVQCMPETPAPILYCEAQSEESWPALAAILTAERRARLHNAGFSDPGRVPNYWKEYPFDKNADAAIAAEILNILYEVYGYTGAARLDIMTETH